MAPDPDFNDEENGVKKEEKAFAHFESSIGKVHHFYISDFVGPPKDYIEMIHTIRTAQPFDTIYIYLNTRGGDFATGAQLIPIMHSSVATIVTVCEGQVCSLGTMIFLAGGEMVIQDHSLFMIHNHSGFISGKGHEYLAEATAVTGWVTQMARDLYIGFLTEEEFESMLKGEDFWFHAEEARKRLNRCVKYQEKKLKEKVAKEKERETQRKERQTKDKEKETE